MGIWRGGKGGGKSKEGHDLQCKHYGGNRGEKVREKGNDSRKGKIYTHTKIRWDPRRKTKKRPNPSQKKGEERLIEGEVGRSDYGRWGSLYGPPKRGEMWGGWGA